MSFSFRKPRGPLKQLLRTAVHVSLCNLGSFECLSVCALSGPEPREARIKRLLFSVAQYAFVHLSSGKIPFFVREIVDLKFLITILEPLTFSKEQHSELFSLALTSSFSFPVIQVECRY